MSSKQLLSAHFGTSGVAIASLFVLASCADALTFRAEEGGEASGVAEAGPSGRRADAEPASNATPRPQVDAGDASPPTSPQVDAGHDASSPTSPRIDAGDAASSPMPSRIDAGDDASSSASGAFTSCKEFNAAIDGFVAAHADCTVDSDCAIVGDCSHADWRAIAAPFAEEANHRVRAGQCGSSDGPGANAVCDRGKCVAARASLWCGSVPETECPSGSVRSYAGCGAVASTYTEGCHVPCTESADESGCPQGYTCQTTSTDPCRAATLGQDTCAACGHEAVQCLPAPGCALKLSARFQGNRVAPKLHSGESTVLELWLENLTNTKLEVSFELPCHGPEVSGLAGYDVWNSCLAGVCQAERVQTQLTLQPHAKTLWRSAVLRAGSSDCNPDGLAAGTYRPSFDLNVSGVPTCGPEPVELTVAP